MRYVNLCVLFYGHRFENNGEHRHVLLLIFVFCDKVIDNTLQRYLLQHNLLKYDFVSGLSVL